MPHVILMVLDWMLLYNTDGAEKQPHTPSPSTDKQVRHFVFSRGFPATWHQTTQRWIDSWWLFGCCWFFGISYIAVLGFQASFTACGSMCRPFLCQQCHVFLWQGQRDTNCTTICVIQYNRKAVFHDFYLWTILCNRFFCRSDEQIIPCTIFLTEDYIPSRWHPCGSMVTSNRLDVFCHNFETDVCTVHSNMGPLSFQHTEKRLLKIVQSEMNILHNILHLYVFFFFPFFFFLPFDACVCMIWCGWLTGLYSLGEAITHLNKNDEPPSETLCLLLTAIHIQLLVILICKFTNECFIVKYAQIQACSYSITYLL